ncbi:MAG: ATP-binding protein [Hyphomicrobiales bacterium]|nr:ATP-binding protein [Hyphomicrobiales bacterium]
MSDAAMSLAPRSVAAQAILQAMPNPLVVLDAANTIVYANMAAEQFFQTSLKMLQAMSITDIIPSTSPVFGLISAVRADEASANEYEVLVGTPRSGGERLVDIQAAVVLDEPGCVLLQVLTRSMAQKIDKQLTHRGAARTVSGLATMLAHEIKNPLSGIRGAAQLIEPSVTGDDLALARLIRDETDRIGGLVDQLEIFSDERPIDRVAINIHAVLDHVKTLARTGVARDVTIHEQYDPSLPLVLGNRDQLVQVFLNLVKNAAEAIAEAGNAGQITLTTAYRPGIKLAVPGGRERISLPLEVNVHNTGSVIPNDLLPHVFEPFYSTRAGGKGLGLPLVAKIIGDHGGVVECQSLDDRTTFRVLLPMHSADQQPPANTP